MTERALIVGWGSIGKQHGAALTSLGHECAAVTTQDCPHPRFETLEKALLEFKPSYVVVSNPTSEHFDTVSELARRNFRGLVLVEKPLFHENIRVPQNAFKKIGIGYQLRFHPALQALRDALRNESVVSCHCYCGQYLPEWRPQSDYRRSYSADRSKGGGVLRDLSHEIDYLLWLFGAATNIKAIGGKYSELEISSEDTVGMVCAFERCPVSTTQLNYLDRSAKRELIVNTKKNSYAVNLRESSIKKNSEPVKSFPAHPLLESLHLNMIGDSTPTFCTTQEAERVMAFINDVDSQLNR